VPETASIGDRLERAAVTLERAGHSGARREARALWAAVTGVSPGAVWLARDTDARGPEVARFEAALARRCAGVPFAYAVGRTAFRDLELAVDERALIPRPETEGLVALALRVLGPGLGAPRRGRAADIGTGCGCIALALAAEGDFAEVVAVERSSGAAALARENVARVGPPVPVEVREGDLLEPLRGERFRAIVSNPPYLTTAELAALDWSVRGCEPTAALDGGPDGLAPTCRLLAHARELLEPAGILALEIDERRAGAVVSLGVRYGWARTAIHEDLFGRPRYAIAYGETP